MPADRTIPLASTTAPPAEGEDPATLSRNQACLTCRSRKVKCDALRPACSPCRKSAIVRREDPNVLICTYDEAKIPTGKKPRRARKSTGKVDALESKIADLEKLIRSGVPSRPPADFQTQSFPYPPPVPSYSPPFASTSAAGQAYPAYAYPASAPVASTSASPMMGIGHTSSGLTDLADAAAEASFDMSFEQSISTLEPFEKQAANDAGSFEDVFSSLLQAPITSGDLLELIYPGWPKDLPSPDLVKRLCENFFAADNSRRDMINRAAFMTGLSHAPTHSRFPSVALLHAICATACLYHSPANDPLGLYDLDYWRTSASPDDYHLACAKTAVDFALQKGQKLFQVAQAVVLVCIVSYAKSRFVGVWTYSGLSLRIATPLGLNHLETVVANGYSSAIKPALLEPPATEAERYERAATFWLCFCCETFAAANTGWAHSCTLDDISTMLPSEAGRASNAKPSIVKIEALDHRSPTFLTSHPSTHVKASGMLIKSVILLSRINTFLQRAPYPIGSRIDASIDAPAPDLRDSPDFKRLDADTVAFRLSMPRDLHKMLEGGDVSDAPSLVLAHQVAHVCTILLHEPWCSIEPGDASMQRCLQSAQAVLLRLTHRKAILLAQLSPFITFTWSIAGRTLVRQKAIYDQRGETVNSERTAQQINEVIATLSLGAAGALENLAQTCANTLRDLSENSEACLPKFGANPTAHSCAKMTCAPFDVIDDLEAGITGRMGLPMGFKRSLTTSRRESTVDGTSLNTPSPLGASASAFLLNVEQAHEAGKGLSEEQIRQLFQPFSGEVQSPALANWTWPASAQM